VREGMKKPKGIKIIAGLKLLFGIIFLIFVGGLALPILGTSTMRIPLKDQFFGLFVSLYIFVYVINAPLLLTLKNWARKVSIVFDLGGIIIDLFVFIPGVVGCFQYGFGDTVGEIFFYGFHLLLIAIFLAFVFYLTRPKVKEQFK
jgi:hypothetical protein